MKYSWVERHQLHKQTLPPRSLHGSRSPKQRDRTFAFKGYPMLRHEDQSPHEPLSNNSQMPYTLGTTVDDEEPGSCNPQIRGLFREKRENQKNTHPLCISLIKYLTTPTKTQFKSGPVKYAIPFINTSLSNLCIDVEAVIACETSGIAMRRRIFGFVPLDE